MIRVFLRRAGRVGLLLLVIALGLGRTSRPAWATGPLSVRVSAQAGAARLDDEFRRFDVDTRSDDARALGAVFELAGWSMGGRLGRFHSEHTLLSGGVGLDPLVARLQWTHRELLVGRQLIGAAGFGLGLSAGVGRVRLEHQPDHVSLPVGSGAPLEVDLPTIEESFYSAGITIDQRVAGPVAVGIEANRFFVELDSADRVGTLLVRDRGWHGVWSARVSLSLRVTP